MLLILHPQIYQESTFKEPFFFSFPSQILHHVENEVDLRFSKHIFLLQMFLLFFLLCLILLLFIFNGEKGDKNKERADLISTDL